MRLQKSYYLNPTTVEESWFLLDASGLVLGRLASAVASLVRGKKDVTYTPSVDNRTFVVIVNAGNIKVTGSKSSQKKYYSHSGYPGGLKTYKYSDWIESKPERILYHAIKGMLPKSKLNLIRKVKIYGGAEHPHQAQSLKAFPGQIK